MTAARDLAFGPTAASGGIRLAAARMLNRLADRLQAPPQPLAPRVSGRCSLETLLRAYLARDKRRDPPALLFLLSLEDIRLAFGQEWGRVGRRVMMLADKIIGECLPPSDCYSHHGDDSLLLMIVERHAGAGRATLQRTVRQLRQTLGGGAGGAAGTSGVSVKPVTLTEALRVQAPRAINAAPAAATPAPAAAPMTAAQLAERIHRQIAFTHRPVWTPARQEIGAFLCLARRTADYGTFTGKWVLNGGYDDPFAYGVDLRALDTVLGALARGRRMAQRPRVILPLHLASLLGEGGERLLQQLGNRIDEKDRDYLILEIVGPLETLPLGRLPALIGSLKGMVAEVWVRALHGKTAELLPHLRGADAFGIDLNDLTRNDPDPLQRETCIVEFGALLKGRAVTLPRPYVWDVRTMAELGAAHGIGAAMQAGPAVMADLEAPRNCQGLSTRDLGLP